MRSNFSFATSLTSINSIIGTFAALVVLKIIFLDIIVSLGDAVTDILQGIHLIYWPGQHSGEWELKTTWKYGLSVLGVCWVPGVVCVLHILAHFRSAITSRHLIYPIL